MNTPESTPHPDATLDDSNLAFEPSPWLQRQLGGAVQWRPWGAAALATAQALDRPLLLVVASENCLPFAQMAAESFANPTTAAVLNEGFVCCLADARWHRELDRQLQVVHQLLVGRAGGWPLLALIDPADARPCFAGTYFPAAPAAPLPGFADFLRQALAHFRRQRVPLQAQGERLAKAFAQLAPPPLPPHLSLVALPLELARQQLATQFDRDAGAFTRGQPVLPAPAAQRLLRHWAQGAATPEPDLQALYMATLALTRASTATPTHPAELAAFAAAAAATGDPAFRLAAEQTYAALATQGETGAPPLPAVENWHRLRAMAQAASWLDRPDWAETTQEQYAATTLHAATTAHATTLHAAATENGAALATALAMLELHWSGTTFQHACELATALSLALASPAPSALPGLPAAPAQADDTWPAPAGMAALALYRLGCLCGNAGWQSAAATLLRRAWRPMNDAPSTHLTLLDALEEQVLGLETIVIRGLPAEAASWARALGRWYAPARQVFAIPADTTGLPPRLATLLPAAADTNANVAAWVFTGDAAPSPSHSLEQLTRELRDRLQRH